ncbi:hypothetical protein KFZ56_17965 [Virgibacillus sp. NKC19-3]|uniref:hypothetical protein n=1 Tax=Virgibacillus saliphilus TaxID=2831674 RepID=UPI001C9A7FAC|nr:hypothetical protein [Virgibacillus sp. NKC19-3]MBY7144905.1 hypothetical protein [Virgibacillus sp. NKC19-3]
MLSKVANLVEAPFPQVRLDELDLSPINGESQSESYAWKAKRKHGELTSEPMPAYRNGGI